MKSTCQPYHALVTTPSGPLPLGVIVETQKLDLEIYDRTGTTRVVAVQSGGTRPVLRIVLKNGNTLDSTADHWVLAETGEIGTASPQSLSWIEVGKLKPGMRLVQRTDTAIRAQGELDVRATSEAILAGWLQGDGFASASETLVELMTADDEEFEYLRPHVARVFEGAAVDVRAVETDADDLSLRRLRLKSEGLSPFIKKFGLAARGLDLRVPDAILRGGHTIATAYLRALFQTNGTIRRGDGNLEGCEIELATSSEDLARDAQKLLANLGLYSRLAAGRDRRLAARAPRWTLTLGPRAERQKFREMIGFVSAAKQEELEQSLAGAPKGVDVRATMKYESIVRIEYTGEHEVFDIQTQSGNYLSGNLVVHNCTIV